jgi:hypothetical protein
MILCNVNLASRRAIGFEAGSLQHFLDRAKNALSSVMDLIKNNWLRFSHVLPMLLLSLLGITKVINSTAPRGIQA